MNDVPLRPGKRVTLSDLHTVGTGRTTVASSRDLQPDRAAAEMLLSQGWIRIGAAFLLAVVQAGVMVLARRSHSGLLLLVVVTFVYGAFVLAVRGVVRRLGRAPSSLVTLALAGDLGLVFVVTAVAGSPEHYERALLGAMLVINAGNFYFGRRQAWRAVGISIASYGMLVLLAGARGLSLDLLEGLWSLAIAMVGTAFVITQATSVRRRLHDIVELFERAESGDFTRSYDERADRIPDSITRVGRAYNRVREQLASMVLTDPLTGCLNRRGFEQACAREVARARRTGNDLSLLVVDLDHFKMVNDSYGHPAGDEVLRDAGRLLIHAGRAGDIVTRVGGEEFAILLPDTSPSGAMHVALQLCETMRDHGFQPSTSDGEPIHLTMSIGVASRILTRTDDGVALTARADLALYAAKRAGRDRACEWTPALEAAGEGLRMPGQRVTPREA